MEKRDPADEALFPTVYQGQGPRINGAPINTFYICQYCGELCYFTAGHIECEKEANAFLEEVLPGSGK